MPTLFKLQPLQEKHELELTRFQQALPPAFKIESRSDGLYIRVTTPVDEDERTQYLVDRELDRLYFLTYVRFRAEMCRRTVFATLTMRWNIQAPLPSTIAPLDWSYELALQLRLWAIAAEVFDPIPKILLLYQIIELAHPDPKDFPSYSDSSAPPHPLTECKMLRHLVSHAGAVSTPGLKNYCAYIGLPPLMLDRTDPEYVAIISAKAPLIETEARACLQSAAS